MKINALRLIAAFSSESKEYEFTPPLLFADGITFTLEQREGTYRLAAKSEKPLGLRSMALEFTYQSEQDLTNAKVYQTTAPPRPAPALRRPLGQPSPAGCQPPGPHRPQRSG